MFASVYCELESCDIEDFVLVVWLRLLLLLQNDCGTSAKCESSREFGVAAGRAGVIGDWQPKDENNSHRGSTIVACSNKGKRCAPFEVARVVIGDSL
jgi:hypothetical protein